MSTAAVSPTVRLSNPFWDIEIGVREHTGPYRVTDRTNNIVIADEDYCYKVTVVTGKHRHASLGVTDVVATESSDKRGQHVILEGRFKFAALGPTDVGFGTGSRYRRTDVTSKSRWPLSIGSDPTSILWKTCASASAR